MTRSEEELVFFYQLGLAISQWSFVESSIYQIVAAAVEPGDRYGIGFGLFSVENFRSKLAFSDALFKKKITNRVHLEEWSKLVDRLQRTVVKRNRLAHERVMLYDGNAPGRRIALERWPSDKPRPVLQLRKPTAGALCMRDIFGIRQEFFYLALALENFSAKLGRQKLPPQECDGSPKGPPTIRAIRNQIREALQLPPLSLRRKS